jgi:cytochrome P450
MSESAARFRYDPFSPEAMRDPHSFYPVLREEHPAYFIPEYDTWVFSRYQDVWDGFMDSEHYSEAEGRLFASEVLQTHHRGNPPEFMIEPEAGHFAESEFQIGWTSLPIHIKRRDGQR